MPVVISNISTSPELFGQTLKSLIQFCSTLVDALQDQTLPVDVQTNPGTLPACYQLQTASPVNIQQQNKPLTLCKTRATAVTGVNISATPHTTMISAQCNYQQTSVSHRCMHQSAVNQIHAHNSTKSIWCNSTFDLVFVYICEFI